MVMLTLKQTKEHFWIKNTSEWLRHMQTYLLTNILKEDPNDEEKVEKKTTYNISGKDEAFVR